MQACGGKKIRRKRREYRENGRYSEGEDTNKPAIDEQWPVRTDEM